MPTLINTRPSEDSKALSMCLHEMGVDVIESPLLRVRNIKGDQINTDIYQSLIFTSANGVRALSKRTDKRRCAVFAVGDATAQEAKSAGFASVISASGDVDDLVEVISQHAVPAAGPLFHAAGTAVAGDMAGTLSARGFVVHREQLYEAEAASSLSSDAISVIRDARADGVLIYSPRTARTFDVVVAHAHLGAEVARLTLFALSHNVDAASSLSWGKRIVAKKPNQESLLEAVRTCYY